MASSARAPRLAWLTDHFPPGGGGMATSCDRIVQALAERGCPITVVHFTAAEAVGAMASGWTRTRAAFGARIAVSAAGDGAHAQRLGWTLLAGEHAAAPFTQVVAFGGALALAAGPVYAAWLGLPLVTLLRGNDFDLAVFAGARQSLLREALEHSRVVCCVSAEMADRVRAWHPAARVEVVGNGIDLARWQPLPSDRAHSAQWRALTVPPGRRVIGLVGDLKLKKGVLALLETLVALGLLPEVHLLVIGRCDPAVDQFLDRHRDRLAATRLPPQSRESLLQWYPAMDWIACPSFYDGMPNVLLEAMALGIPALASRAGGVADLVEDGVNGCLFAPADRRALAAGLVTAVRMPEPARAALGAAAADTIASRFDVAREAQDYLRVLAGEPGRPCLDDRPDGRNRGAGCPADSVR